MKRVLGGVIVLAACAATLLPSAVARSSVDLRATCGGERWRVATLTDRARLIPVGATTIPRLEAVPAPSKLPTRRLPLEQRIYGIRSMLPAATDVVRGADGNVRLVLRQGPDSIVAVIPSPRCVAGATALRRRQMTRARSAVRQCGHAFVTGVAYYSASQGRTTLELRPLLDFGCV